MSKENSNKKINKWLSFNYNSILNDIEKEDKFRIIKLTRVNPKGTYGTFYIDKEISEEQLTQIENILGITLEDYYQ